MIQKKGFQWRLIHRALTELSTISSQLDEHHEMLTPKYWKPKRTSEVNILCKGILMSLIEK